MNKLVLLSAISLICYACTETTDQKRVDIKETYPWNISKDEDTPFDKLKSDYIILHNEPANKLIGSIEKMVSYNDCFFIKSKDHLNVYDQSGRYLRSIGGKGKARNEYIYMSDFSIYDNIIFILDWQQSIVLSYDLNGNFLEKKKTPISSLNGILAVKDGFIFHRPRYGSEKPNELFTYAITTTDRDMNILKQEMKYNEHSPKVINPPSFNESGDVAFFHEFLTGYFTQIDRNTTAKTAFGVDFLSEKILPSEIENSELIYSKDGNKRLMNCTPILFKNWIFGRTRMNRKSKNFAINLDTKKIYEDNEYLNVISSSIGFNSNNILIPYEFNDQNKNHANLPDSIQTASENGENVIIKIDIKD